MYYGNIKPVSVENGDGIRVSFFVSGCRNHCEGCFSQCTWDFNYGYEYTEDVKKEILKSLSPIYVQGLTILGGEPLEPENQQSVLDLILSVKKEMPQKDIWVYSGFTIEQITGEEPSRCQTPYVIDILKNIDVLIDGKFMESKKDISLKFRGSSNQRVIDVKSTLRNFEHGKLNIVKKYE